MLHSLFVAVLMCAAALPARGTGPAPEQIKNLVTFGDSYTDITAHADGGTMWPVFAAEEGHFNLTSFAHHGAACYNNLTPGQIPLYFTEFANGSLVLDPKETMYTLWIGTNDVGVSGLLTGKIPNQTVVNTTQCAINWVTTLYQSGARNFIFQNMIPLEQTILYSADSYPNRYWTLERNTTEWNTLIPELVAAGNEIAQLKLEVLASKLKGAHIGLFDSHALFSDMYHRPEVYLNGTAPLNVTGAVHACVFELNESTSDNGTCTDAVGTDQDSFLWYDELHPSVQAERVVAKAISDAIHRKTEQWITWLS